MQTNIPISLQANIKQPRPVSVKYNTDNIKKQWPSIYRIKTTSYEVAWLMSSVLTLHRSVQLKLDAVVNWTMKHSQQQIKTCL